MTTRNRLIDALLAAALDTSAGCASYRVESNIEERPAPPAATSAAAQVLPSEGSLPGRNYTATGPVEVYVAAGPDLSVSEYVDHETNEII